MTAPVEVLAVMDRVDDRLERLGDNPDGDLIRDLREARAAVGELIEAAIDAHDFAANTAHNEKQKLDRRFYRLRAALARCKGGAA